MKMGDMSMPAHLSGPAGRRGARGERWALSPGRTASSSCCQTLQAQKRPYRAETSPTSHAHQSDNAATIATNSGSLLGRLQLPSTHLNGLHPSPRAATIPSRHNDQRQNARTTTHAQQHIYVYDTTLVCFLAINALHSRHHRIRIPWTHRTSSALLSTAFSPSPHLHSKETTEHHHHQHSDTHIAFFVTRAAFRCIVITFILHLIWLHH
jgi:hypothetical protein